MLMLMACGLLVLGWTRERTHDAITTNLAREARQRLKALSESAGALAETSTLAEVSRVIVDHSTRIAGADTCTLYLLSEAGDALDLIGERGCAWRGPKLPDPRDSHRSSVVLCGCCDSARPSGWFFVIAAAARHRMATGAPLFRCR